MRSVRLGHGSMQCSALGFGCSAVMGRAGRKASLAALAAAYDAGVTLYDTARSYGYGESETLLGEFLRGRRDSVVVSTKFGILPAPSSLLKQVAKPLVRSLVKTMPKLRQALQSQVAAQFSEGHFTVEALRSSLETSLRKLQTGFVDILFLHLPPLSVLQQDDLFAALEQLMVEGKVLRVGIAAPPAIALAALDAQLPHLRTIQVPCNLFDLGLTERLSSYPGDVLAMANHPFGGPHRVAESKRLLYRLAQDQATPESLRFKLWKLDDVVLADLVLNLIIGGTGIQIVLPSMLRLDHLRANIVAMEHSRFTAEELQWLRASLLAAERASRRASRP